MKRRFVTSAIWPDKHKEILREMHAKGATALEIAIALNRTRNSVIGFIHRSGLSTAGQRNNHRLKQSASHRKQSLHQSINYLSSQS